MMLLIDGMTLEALEALEGPQFTDRYTEAVGQVIEAEPSRGEHAPTRAGASRRPPSRLPAGRG
ncbi:hypothetical protein QBA35_35330 [Streptomyces bottropensis]|uniref:Uncharacterized protein n=1 Tax=Streptomyces bottropensis TaxID=42235 RepID=A0ABU8AXS5_9ACTN